MNYSKTMLLTMAAMGMFIGGSGGNSYMDPDTEITIEREKLKYQAYLKKKGVQKFSIDGYEVYARDLKNATRKVNNFKKLLPV